MSKRYLLAVAAHNLGRIMRKLFGIGKPKAMQLEADLAAFAQLLTSWQTTLLTLCLARDTFHGPVALPDAPSRLRAIDPLTSTGC